TATAPLLWRSGVRQDGPKQPCYPSTLGRSGSSRVTRRDLRWRKRLRKPRWRQDGPNVLPTRLLLGDQLAPILRFGFRHPQICPPPAASGRALPRNAYDQSHVASRTPNGSDRCGQRGCPHTTRIYEDSNYGD